MQYYDIIIIGGGAAGLMAAVGAGNLTGTTHSGNHLIPGQYPEVRSGKEAGNACRKGLNSKDTAKVLVFEKMPRPGRKIMITGKGQCNFTNVKAWEDFSGHIHPAPNLLKPSFFNLTPEKLIGMFNDAGLDTVIERGDRAFPASHKASDVVDTLVRMATEAGVEIKCGKEVVSIEPHFGRTDGDASRAEWIEGIEDKKDKDSIPETSAISRETDGNKSDNRDCRYFIVKCADGSIYCCDRLIVTTGGLSYPASGSSGDGLVWARNLKLDVHQLFPSLTAIVPEGYKQAGQYGGEKGNPSVRDSIRGHIDRSTPLSTTGRALCGVELDNVNLTVLIDGNPVCEEFGDIAFTDGGLEGPAGFKISRRCVRAVMNGSKVSISIDLKPAVDTDRLDSRISSLWKEISADRRSHGLKYRDRLLILLGKLLPRQAARGFLLCNPNTDHTTLANTLKNWKTGISGFVGYERCVITAGGISAAEINPRTMESRKIPGLHFAGEILDLDGDTGGYNLHIAFSTGYLAGQSAGKSLPSHPVSDR